MTETNLELQISNLVATYLDDPVEKRKKITELAQKLIQNEYQIKEWTFQDNIKCQDCGKQDTIGRIIFFLSCDHWLCSVCLQEKGKQVGSKMFLESELAEAKCSICEKNIDNKYFVDYLGKNMIAKLQKEAQNNYQPLPNQNEEEKVKFCEICLEDHPKEQWIAFDQCKHEICQFVLQQEIGYRVEECDNQQNVLLCPYDSKPFKFELVSHFLDEEVLKAYSALPKAQQQPLGNPSNNKTPQQPVNTKA